MTPEQRIAHGKELLDNPVFQEALQEVNKGISRDMDKLSPTDKEGAHSLVLMRKAANKIYQYIISEAENKDAEIKQFNARPKRFFK